MARFFVEEVLDAAGHFIAFGVMDRENPDDILNEFSTLAEAETEAGLCNETEPDAEHRLRLMEAGL
jgi:hypothetical protein